jgi:hypothetical protein
MNKVKFFYVLLGVVLLAGAGVYLNGQYAVIKAAGIEAAKVKIATHIQERAQTMITSEDFATTDTVRQQAAFKAFWDSVQSPEYVRAKIWNKEFTIVWADLTELIGQRFTDNHEVAEALEGEIEFEIEEEKTEHVSERQYEELAEVYVPFRGADGAIAGVFEVYQPTIELNKAVWDNFMKVATPVLLLVALAYLLLAFALRYFLNARASSHETVA